MARGIYGLPNEVRYALALAALSTPFIGTPYRWIGILLLGMSLGGVAFWARQRAARLRLTWKEAKADTERMVLTEDPDGTPGQDTSTEAFKY